MAIFALAFVIVLFSYIPEPDLEAAKSNNEKEEGVGSLIKGALSYKHFVFGIISIFLYVGIEVGIPNTVNLYLTTAAENGGFGMATSTAGALVGFYWLLMLVGRLIGGAIGAKVSSRAMVATVSGLALVFLTLGILLPGTEVLFPSVTSELSFELVNVPLGVVFFILCGLCTSVMWGAIFNLAVEGLGKYTSIASGLFMVMVCGGGVLPFLQGLVADAAGFMPSFWVLVAAVAFILWYALLGSKVKRS